MQFSVVIPNFNNAHWVVQCVQSFLAQSFSRETRVNVVVVDDGSTDDSVKVLQCEFGDRITLIAFPENRGRCSARNAGAAAHDADVFLFVDSDCVASDARFIEHHAHAISSGADVVFGEVHTPGTDFWSCLQQRIVAQRKIEFANGRHWVFTTANVSIRREVFRAAGGFDLAFDRHGFEDRDLFIRLGALGAKAAFCSEARLLHSDELSLEAVSAKFERLGAHAAAQFSARHPDIYRAMSQSRLDVRQRPWLKHVDNLAWPLVRRLRSKPANWLEWRWLPFALRSLLARTVYGLSFMHGTRAPRQDAET